LAGDQQVMDLVLRFYADAWNRWDDSAVDDLLAPDFVFRGSLGDEARGRDGFRSYRDKVRAAFPDFHNEVRELVVEGERAAVRLLCTGRHDGELFGIEPTGRRIAYEAAAFFRASRTDLRAAWVLGDLDGLRAQLGP
jgi:predicted ester cyclase